MALYLLHFETPLGDPTRPRMSASHYLGYSPTDVTRLARIESHLKGTSKVAITKAAYERGIVMLVGWLGDGTQDDERRMKKAGHYADRWCQICLGASATRILVVACTP